MEKIQGKEFYIIIDSGIDKETNEILDRYWRFNDGSFKEQIGKIGEEFCLKYTLILRIIKKHSSGYIIDYCHDCTKQLFYKVKSQTKFLQHFHSNNYCHACQGIISENQNRHFAELKKKHIATRKHRLNHAIQTRAWEKLNLDECRVLLGFIKDPNRTIDFGNLKDLKRNKKQKLIDKYDSLGLIARGVDYGYYKLKLDFSKYLPRKLRCHLLEWEKKYIRENFKNEDMEVPF